MPGLPAVGDGVGEPRVEVVRWVAGVLPLRLEG